MYTPQKVTKTRNVPPSLFRFHLLVHRPSGLHYRPIRSLRVNLGSPAAKGAMILVLFGLSFGGKGGGPFLSKDSGKVHNFLTTVKKRRAKKHNTKKDYGSCPVFLPLVGEKRACDRNQGRKDTSAKQIPGRQHEEAHSTGSPRRVSVEKAAWPSLGRIRRILCANEPIFFAATGIEF